MVSRHNRVRTRSERWPSLFSVTVFLIFAQPALPVLRCQGHGDLRRPFAQAVFTLECGQLNRTIFTDTLLTRTTVVPVL